MKIFIICPVRGATDGQQNDIRQYISVLKSRGDTVYYPADDTDQTDATGYRICADNRKAMLNSDEAHIYWDKNSRGSLFDLGMAFAMHKPIKIINGIELSIGKSFTNMICRWSEL